MRTVDNLVQVCCLYDLLLKMLRNTLRLMDKDKDMAWNLS